MSGRARSVSPAELELVEDVVRRETGVTFTPGTRDALWPAAEAAAEAAGMELPELLRLVREGEAGAVQLLVEHALVGETYFFRHPEQFEALRLQLFPSWPATLRPKIWCAACSTGEEAYSLAITLRAAGRPESDRVLGTDFSARSLARAREGAYGKWSFRRMEQPGPWFEPVPGGLRVAAPIRNSVEFRRHNLLTEPPPLSGCDLISCRNALLYFTPELARAVLARLAAALAPGGILLLSVTELPLAAGLPLQRLDLEGAALLRRPGAEEAVPPPPGRAVRTLPTPAATRRPGPGTRPRAAANDPAEQLEPPRPTPAPLPLQPLREAASPPAGPGAFERAREAAACGRLGEAEALAREAVAGFSPEACLLLAMIAESRGDLGSALESLRGALYLEPDLPVARASQALLLERLGRPEEAARAREHALRTLSLLPSDAPLRAVEPITAGALRRALGVPDAG